MCKLLVDIHRLMKLHVTCYFTIKQHISKYLYYVQFGSNISPDYVMPADTPRHVKPNRLYIVVFAFWISEYMAIAVESAEMGGGGG